MSSSPSLEPIEQEEKPRPRLELVTEDSPVQEKMPENIQTTQSPKPDPIFGVLQALSMILSARAITMIVAICGAALAIMAMLNPRMETTIVLAVYLVLAGIPTALLGRIGPRR